MSTHIEKAPKSDFIYGNVVHITDPLADKSIGHLWFTLREREREREGEGKRKKYKEEKERGRERVKETERVK